MIITPGFAHTTAQRPHFKPPAQQRRWPTPLLVYHNEGRKFMSNVRMVT